MSRLNHTTKVLFAVAALFCSTTVMAQSEKSFKNFSSYTSSTTTEEGLSWGLNSGRYVAKTNALMFLGGVSNIGAEVALSKKFSLDLPLYYSPYAYAQNWSLKCLGTQPEFRFWFKRSLAGHYIGAHAHVMVFNVAVNEGYRYESNDNEPSWGAGLGYGYALSFNEDWGMEFSIGAGYTQLHYNRYFNTDNGALIKSDIKKHYYGVTKLGVVLTYRF